MIRIMSLCGSVLVAAAVAGGVVAPAAGAVPGQCFYSPWGGFCDYQSAPDGSFWHCEEALGFSNCFQACHDPVINRAVPTDMDWNTPC